jgi:toxin ParE1/3/4
MPAKFRVSITRVAENDIEQAWSFIAQDSPEAADKFISQLEEQIETLEIFPNRCPLIPENEILGTAYRHMVYGDHRTVFRLARRDSLRPESYSRSQTTGRFHVRRAGIIKQALATPSLLLHVLQSFLNRSWAGPIFFRQAFASVFSLSNSEKFSTISLTGFSLDLGAPA